MNAQRSSHFPIFALFAAITLLLAACQPAAITTNPPPTQPPTLPSATAVLQATLPPVKATQPPAGAPGEFNLDLSAMAPGQTVETIAAVPAGADRVWTEVMPQHRRLTLQGYPVTSHVHKAQIFIYPVDGLSAANENTAKIVTDLKTLLQSRQAGDQLPFLPPIFSSIQAANVQVQYLDFKSGKGVRFLTQFNNGLVPINNNEIIYTFQGLTSDGKYYVSAVLPVTHPELPANSLANGPLKAGQEYRDVLSKTIALLNQQAGDRFTPDLSKLDALVRSIEVK